MNVKSGKCDLKYHLLLFITVNAFPVNVIGVPLPLAHGGFTKSTTLTLLRTVLSVHPRPPTDPEAVHIHRQVDVCVSPSTPSTAGDNSITNCFIMAKSETGREAWRLSRPAHWARSASDERASSVVADGMLLFFRFLSRIHEIITPKAINSKAELCCLMTLKACVPPPPGGSQPEPKRAFFFFVLLFFFFKDN